MGGRFTCAWFLSSGRRGFAPAKTKPPFCNGFPSPPSLPPPPIRRPRWRQTDACCPNAGLNLTLHGAQRRAFRSPGKQPLHFIRPWNSEWKALASGCLAMRGSGEGVREGGGGGEDGQNTPAQRRPLPPLLWLLGGLWDSWGAVHPAQEHFVVTGSLWAGGRGTGEGWRGRLESSLHRKAPGFSSLTNSKGSFVSKNWKLEEGETPHFTGRTYLIGQAWSLKKCSANSYFLQALERSSQWSLCTSQSHFLLKVNNGVHVSNVLYQHVETLRAC